MLHKGEHSIQCSIFMWTCYDNLNFQLFQTSMVMYNVLSSMKMAMGNVLSHYVGHVYVASCRLPCERCNINDQSQRLYIYIPLCIVDIYISTRKHDHSLKVQSHFTLNLLSSLTQLCPNDWRRKTIAQFSLWLFRFFLLSDPLQSLSSSSPIRRENI